MDEVYLAEWKQDGSKEKGGSSSEDVVTYWLQRNAKIFIGEEPDVRRTSHQIIQDIQESGFASNRHDRSLSLFAPGFKVLVSI